MVYSTTLLMFQKSTGLSVLACPHVHLTQLRDGDLSRTGLTVLVYPHFSLDTVEDVMGGECLRHGDKLVQKVVLT